MTFKKSFAVIAASLIVLGCTKNRNPVENAIEYGLRRNLRALDPAQASEETATEVIPSIFETLLEYHYLKRPLTTQPLLADGPPEISKDGQTVKIKIKPGVKFHDSEVFPNGKGRDVLAQDFVFSWKRLADPRLKGEGFWVFDGKIKGLNDWRERLAKGRGKFEDPVTGLETPDEHTLIIHLTFPFYLLNYMLAMPYTSVVPHEAVEKYGEEFMNHPVGTGPFRFESWVRGSKVVLVKNPTWHGGNYPTEGEPGDRERGLLADAGKPLPFVDKLIFHEIPEEQTRWLNVMKGLLDFMAIPKDSFPTAIENGKLKPALEAKGFQLWVYPWLEVVYSGFNMTDPILGKNVELRRALSMTYDGELVRKKFYSGQAIVAQSPLAPDMEGYDPAFRNPYREFNIEKAKEHLRKAGFPDGKGLPAIEYSVPSTTVDRQKAEYLQQQFAQIGVKVNIVTFSWPQFVDRLNNRKAQMYEISWLVDYPDETNILQNLYSKFAKVGPNYTGYSNKEFDALFERAERMPPGLARVAVLHKMRDIFVQDLPWIPQVSRLPNLIYQGWILNMKRHENITTMYKYLRVDVKKKAELREKL